MQGLSNGFDFKFNEKLQLFAGNKTNFSPTPKDNLIATYFEHIENFNFKKYTSQSEKLFQIIDELSQTPLENLSYTEVVLRNPYEVESTFAGALPDLLMMFVIAAPFIIIFLLIAILIWALVKWRRIKNRKGL